MIIREKDRLLLIDILSSFELSNCEVFAYGSRVNNKAHDASDIDLVIKFNGNEPLNASMLTAIKSKITNSNIPILVDLKDWARIPDSFKQQILNNQHLFWKSTSHILP